MVTDGEMDMLKMDCEVLAHASKKNGAVLMVK